jgi:phage shock protein PspC (stress-responsive transcriptional regulator)
MEPNTENPASPTEPTADAPAYGSPSPPSVPRRLQRGDDRIVAGVCSGLAEYTGLDVTLVRLVTALLVIFAGSGLLLYVLGWLLIPDSSGELAASRLFGSRRKGPSNRRA